MRFSTYGAKKIGASFNDFSTAVADRQHTTPTKYKKNI